MNRTLLICFILLAAFSWPAAADDCTRYGDDTYGYSICVPGGWKKSYRDVGYRHILTLTRGSAAIVASASRMDDDEKEKWESWKKWYVTGIGAGLMNIIETSEVAVGRQATIKLIVFQYTKRGTTLLQRTMLMKYGNNLLVIECRAPLGTFSNYTDLFNRVMSSADIAGALKGNSMDILNQASGRKNKREETADRTIRTEEKKPVTIEETRPDTGGETKPDTMGETKTDTRGDSTIDTGGEKNADTMADTPESRKVIEAELKKIEELEQKGIIEKVEGGSVQPGDRQ